MIARILRALGTFRRQTQQWASTYTELMRPYWLGGCSQYTILERMFASSKTGYFNYVRYPACSCTSSPCMPVVFSRWALVVRRMASMPGVCSAKVRASSAPMMMSAVV